MDAKQALELLEPIPAKDFITDRFTDEHSKCCVVGHLQRLTSKDPNNYSSYNCSDDCANPVRTKSEEFLRKKGFPGYNIATVNNHAVNGYKQKRIKTRVIHLLKDMIKAGY